MNRIWFHACDRGAIGTLGALVAAMLGLGTLAGCETNSESHYGVHVLDSQRWLWEDQIDALSETRLRRHAKTAAWFFSQDRGHWGQVGGQITDSTDRWARLAEPWPARNLPAQDTDLVDGN